jgi:hypothetical protein
VIRADKRWPDTETAELLALYDDGLGKQEIAERIGRPVAEVESNLNHLSDHLSWWSRRRTAVHEAAHAVALVSRVGSTSEMEVTIYPVGHAGGRVSHNKIPTADQDFVSFAGPWASARYEWEWDHLHEDDAADFEVYLADQMEYGSWGDLLKIHRLVYRYRDKLAERFIVLEPEHDPDGMRRMGYDVQTPDEARAWKAKYRVKIAEAEAAEAERNASWDVELEPLWPVIEKVADALQDGQEVTEGWIQGLLDA